MHEMMVADSLLRIILQQCQDREARAIGVKISCGQLNAINDDVLGFALEAIAKGTACEGIRLEVEHKPLQAECRHCGQVYGHALDADLPRCPGCGGADFRLLPDSPLVLETIEFQEA
jgi:hydrogenase nickel incorporation protein HypA/HybF